MLSFEPQYAVSAIVSFQELKPLAGPARTVWYSQLRPIATVSTGMRSPTRLHSSVIALKHPEYTGENRCLPCTIVNTTIAVGFGVLAAVAAGWLVPEIGSVPYLAGGLVVFLASTVIYFRGYLIPGTPALTKRYFPDWLLALFDKQPTGSAPTEIVPEIILSDIGVVIDDPAADDFGLEQAFASAWRETIERYSDDDALVVESIGQLSGVPDEQIRFEERPRTYMAWVGDDHLASWPSRAACVADAAGATVLPDSDPEWSARPLPIRAELLGVLRLFLDRCPTCNGEVTLSQDVVESCCRSRDVVAATCLDCNARLFETDIDPATIAEK